MTNTYDFRQNVAVTKCTLILINRKILNQEKMPRGKREKPNDEYNSRLSHTRGVSEIAILDEGWLTENIILYRMEYMLSTNSFSAI